MDEALANLYALNIVAGGRRSLSLEREIGWSEDNQPVQEGLRNESEAYTRMFSNDNRKRVEELYRNLMSRMTELPFEECADLLEALAIMQFFVARALWQYHLRVGEELELFAREFDRMDVAEERLRLYRMAND